MFARMIQKIGGLGGVLMDGDGDGGDSGGSSSPSTMADRRGMTSRDGVSTNKTASEWSGYSGGSDSDSRSDTKSSIQQQMDSAAPSDSSGGNDQDDRRTPFSGSSRRESVSQDRGYDRLTGELYSQGLVNRALSVAPLAPVSTPASFFDDMANRFDTYGYTDAADTAEGLGEVQRLSDASEAHPSQALTHFNSVNQNQLKSLGVGGDMGREVVDRNARFALQDPVNEPQSEFAFADTYADDYKGLVDYAARVGDMFIPFISPASGAVDADQAADAYEGVFGKPMPGGEKFAVGAKTAVPGVRAIGGLVGAAQYDNYGKSAPDDLFGVGGLSDDQIQYLYQNNIDPNSAQAKEVAQNWDFFKNYASHSQGFNGRVDRPTRARFK